MDADGLWTVLASFVGGGLATSVINGYLGRHKIDAETGKLNAETEDLRMTLDLKINQQALSMLATMQGQVEKLTTRMNLLEEDNASLTVQNHALRKSVRVMKHHLNRCEIKLDLPEIDGLDGLEDLDTNKDGKISSEELNDSL